MSSGKVNFYYNQFKDTFLINSTRSTEYIADQGSNLSNLNQILLISENLNQKFKNIHIQPLNNIMFDLFHNIFEIHLLLLINKDFSNVQKLDYAKLQRYFMKRYLNEIIKKSDSK